MPTQKQLKWSQLRVGLTVLFASLAFALLIFLMTKTTGLFTPTITVRAYFENASGLRVGAPARLEGVDVGNVTAIAVDTSHPLTPGGVTMKVATKYRMGVRKDSVATLATAGVLGETYVDISDKDAKGPEAQNGDVLKTREIPDIQDVIRASQGTLQNVDILVKRLDRIVSAIERGEGSIGRAIYDPTLYNKLNDSVDKINKLADELEQGQGTVGRLIKDPSLYNNANQTVAKANKLMEDINSGKGALGKFASDPEFAKKLDDTITNLKIVSDRLQAGEGSAGLFLKDPSLYHNADQLLVETRDLIKAIRQNPKKYLTIHLKIF